MVAPRVTIAIPVRNGADFLKEAIDSALAQTYANVEVIVVDDGSDDGGATERIATAYGAHIRFSRQANTGVAGALNRVLREMTGDYYCWLSHDDVYEPDKVATQVEIHRRLGSPEDVVMYSDFAWIDDAGDITGYERFDRTETALHPWLGFYDGRINGCTIYASRRILLEIGGIVEGYPHTQDYQTWWRLSRKARFVHVPAPLVRVRRHARQGSHTQLARQEGDLFWRTVLEATTDLDAALLDGSRERFLRRSVDFLRFRSPNRAAADAASALAAGAARASSVSVVLDLGACGPGAGGAVASVLAQTRRPDQLILVEADIALPEGARDAVAASGIPAVLVASDRAEPAARLRAGLMMASGSYIAFLRAPDAFERDKIERQVEAMSMTGCTISHTSYREPGGIPVPSGSISGEVYPEILGGTPVETSTVMVHRALWMSGILFADADAPVAASWIDAAAGRPLLGLDRPLSTLRPSAAEDRARLLRWAAAHPRHGGHRADLARLRTAIALSGDRP